MEHRSQQRVCVKSDRLAEWKDANKGIRSKENKVEGCGKQGQGTLKVPVLGYKGLDGENWPKDVHGQINVIFDIIPYKGKVKISSLKIFSQLFSFFCALHG